MENKSFSQLTDDAKRRKLCIILRNLTNNQLTADQIQSVMCSISPDRQYTIVLHSIEDNCCNATVDKNVLNIYVPEQIYAEKALADAI